MRRRALRHGHAGLARRVRAHLGHPHLSSSGPKATQRVRRQASGFCFMAEVYWDLEWTLQQQGFDYAYDKRLYDRLRDGHARPVREHFHAGLDYQNKLARFLENHDEPRAAATFPPDSSRGGGGHHVSVAGAAILSSGTIRRAQETHLASSGAAGQTSRSIRSLQQFYDRLLAVLRKPAVRDGHWQLLECVPAWDGNWTWDCFVAFFWQGADGEWLLVVVNYAANQSQCYVRLPILNLRDHQWRLEDLLSDVRYDREGNELESRGLYLDIARGAIMCSGWKSCRKALHCGEGLYSSAKSL